MVKEMAGEMYRLLPATCSRDLVGPHDRATACWSVGKQVVVRVDKNWRKEMKIRTKGFLVLNLSNEKNELKEWSQSCLVNSIIWWYLVQDWSPLPPSLAADCTDSSAKKFACVDRNCFHRES